MRDQFVVITIDMLFADATLVGDGDFLRKLNILSDDAYLFLDHLLPVDLDVAHLLASLRTYLQQLVKQPERQGVIPGPQRQNVHWFLLADDEAVDKVFDHLTVGLHARPGATIDDRVHFPSRLLQEKL